MRAASLKGTLKSKYIMYGLLLNMARIDGTTGLLSLSCSSVNGRSLTLASMTQTATAMAAAKKVPCICTWNWISSGAMK
jgi:hypothetical protein